MQKLAIQEKEAYDTFTMSINVTNLLRLTIRNKVNQSEAHQLTEPVYCGIIYRLSKLYSIDVKIVKTTFFSLTILTLLLVGFVYSWWYQNLAFFY